MLLLSPAIVLAPYPPQVSLSLMNEEEQDYPRKKNTTVTEKQIDPPVFGSKIHEKNGNKKNGHDQTCNIHISLIDFPISSFGFYVQR